MGQRNSGKWWQSVGRVLGMAVETKKRELGMDVRKRDEELMVKKQE